MNFLQSVREKLRPNDKLRFIIALLFLFASTLLGSIEVGAQCRIVGCATFSTGMQSFPANSSISVYSASTDPTEQAAINQSIAAINSHSSANGSGITFYVSSSPSSQTTINFNLSNAFTCDGKASAQFAGCINTFLANSTTLSAAIITVNLANNSLDSERTDYIDGLIAVLLHEFQHALGVGDANVAPGNEGNTLMAGFVGPNGSQGARGLGGCDDMATRAQAQLRAGEPRCPNP